MSFASASSASLQIPRIKYDVFINFRGEDTRNNFTDHLHAALCRKKIDAFIDDQLRRGDEISQSLLDAIEGSMTFVVIFSKDYASSSWCLDELVKILECRNKYGRIVIPIFYQVDPSNVRKQSGIFGDGFMMLIDQHERFQAKLQRWECALRDAGKISGYHLDGNRSESKLTEKIVDDILKKLNDTFPNSSDNKDHLIGLYSRIKETESLLSTELNDICTLGIWGIGGIGKTTIAEAIFNRISSHFEGYCFISNVRGEDEKDGRLHYLRQKLLSALLMDHIVHNGIPNIGLNFESKRLSRKKVLIVFDDVSHFEQIEFLIGDLKFAAGSKIIITTRDKHVLNICRVDFLYEMEKLAHDDALKLFCQHAFGQNNPYVTYEKLSNKVIKYADGVPLALKVLGRFLFRRNKEEWESAIDKLKKNLNMEILKVLKISYDSLDHEEKNIFLDIACFFKHWDRDLVIRFLNACRFSWKIGISVLVDKSLISISDDNTIKMHDLLQEMGREIVRQEANNDLGKYSRLWHHEDIYKVITCNVASEAIEGISLDMSQVKKLNLNPCIFTKMQKLRFLRFYKENKFKVSVYTSIFSKFFNMSYFQGSTFAQLRYLEWHGYPLNKLPSTIHPENLISLKIPNSNIKQLWNGIQELGNLKSLNLAGCKQLGRSPDLSLAQNLEKLDLSDSTSLIEIHSSIHLLNKLQFLSVSGCSNLMRFPKITSCNNLQILYLDETAIEEVPENIFGCHLSSLGELYFDGNDFERIPESIIHLSKLQVLSLRNCERLKYLPELPWSLTNLITSNCTSLESLSGLSGLLNSGYSSFWMEEFDFMNCLKLDRDELNKIGNDVLQKLQLKFTTWYNNRQDQVDFQYPFWGSICFPGSEIPEWISHQSMGSSITFKLPPGCFNNNHFGFAICVIFVSPHHHEYKYEIFDVHCECKIKTKDGYKYTFASSSFPFHFGKRYVESDHVFLAYDVQEYPVCFGEYYDNNETIFQLYINEFFDNFCGAIKKCGLHFFYGQDFGESANTTGKFMNLMESSRTPKD